MAFSAFLQYTEAVKGGEDISYQEDGGQEATKEGIDGHASDVIEDVLEAVEDDGVGATVVDVVLDLGLVYFEDLGEDTEEVIGDQYVKSDRKNNGEY